MSNFKIIQEKLEAFIWRYYINELLKGAILFFSIGLLYLFFTLFIEYNLWLSTSLRTLLFWVFIGVEAGLFVKFIVIPLAKLFKLKRGINYEDASKLIGKYFPEVNDKLLNMLQLHQSASRSDLLLASIDQKSVELNPIPFKLAVNFKENLSYLKYAAIPVLILVLTFFTGNFDWFSSSYQRVINYKTAFEPPAPFQFFVVNNNLNAIENKDFKLIVKTAGAVVPENAQILYNGETYFLHQTALGEFEYVFSQPKAIIDFQLSANNVLSKPYKLNVFEVPSLLSFKMVLNYPNYTKKSTNILKSTGNASVPEGTTVSWLLQTKATKKVVLQAKDTLVFSSDSRGGFHAKKRVHSNYDYTLRTSNNSLNNYENLSFSIHVVKDEYPELILESRVDTLDLQTLYFYGKISDDYGFSSLQLIYYPSDNESYKKAVQIPFSNSNISDFLLDFPDNLEIEEGIPYSLCFQVSDNDEVNNKKTTNSNVFHYKKRTKEEEVEKQLKEQSKTINDLNNSVERFEHQEKQLEELTRAQKEKSTLNFNDKKKLESFFRRQKEQDEMMKNFNKKIKDNINEFQKDTTLENEFQKDLNKRLKDNEDKLKDNEKLLEELKKLNNKIDKEELIQKLEELAKQNKNNKRSLKQLLELTKRFYIEKKLDKLRTDLENIAEEQESLSNKLKEENTKERQDELNKRFNDFKKDIDDLDKESKNLTKPIDIPRDKIDENEIDKDQKNASDSLEKNDNKSLQDAQKSQKSAAQKMKKMSYSMKVAMSGSGGMKIQEDIDMLRQILDNLLLFSFDQESLMNQFESISVNHNKFASFLRKQNYLKEHFEHVDDSLFALSLRQPKISERVNNEISDVYYNIDKALYQFSENLIYQGVSNQHFVITAANNLADFLSEFLDNLEAQMSISPGKGLEGDMQLPDMIMSQEQLNKMMEEGMKNSEKGKPKEGAGEKPGNGKSDGDGNKDGNKGKNGQQGNANIPGQDGSDGLDSQSRLLFEIYQKQLQLRQALEDHLSKKGLGKEGSTYSLIKEMENIELDLLNNGFTSQTLSKMMLLKHQLMKLENATFEQGEDNKRESKYDQHNFDNTNTNQIPTAKQYFNTKEILNRQALPLHQTYKKRVTEYFRQTND